MMYEDMASMTDDVQRRCSLPSLQSTTSGIAGSDLGDDRRLPPLPRIDPLPRGPFSPFHIKDSFGPATPGAQEMVQFKSPWPGSEQMTAPPSPANSAESSWQEAFAAQKAASSGDWPTDLSPNEIMSLIAPEQINRKAPLQQLCGRKRKSGTISPDPDDQREKHRIAEGNRRQNLSQLHRELDSRIHDFFLERAGWNRSKSLPQSKEHIVQGAVYLIDFMLFIIVNLIRQEQITPQLSERLQPQVRCMQLQQQIQALQQQEQAQQQQIRALKAENEALLERNRSLESNLKSFDTMFSTKSETTSPRLIGEVPQHKRQRRALPGLSVFCDEIGASKIPETPLHHDTLPSATSQTFSTSYLTTTPPVTGPSSPAFPPSHSTSFHFPSSRRHSTLTSS